MPIQHYFYFSLAVELKLVVEFTIPDSLRWILKWLATGVLV